MLHIILNTLLVKYCTNDSAWAGEQRIQVIATEEVDWLKALELFI